MYHDDGERRTTLTTADDDNDPTTNVYTPQPEEPHSRLHVFRYRILLNIYLTKSTTPPLHIDTNLLCAFHLQLRVSPTTALYLQNRRYNDERRNDGTKERRNDGMANHEGRRTKDKGRRTKDEGRTTDEGRRTKDEGRRTNDEGRRTNDERRTTNDERQTTNDERRLNDCVSDCE